MTFIGSHTETHSPAVRARGRRATCLIQRYHYGTIVLNNSQFFLKLEKILKILYSRLVILPYAFSHDTVGEMWLRNDGA
jgi:hypothetical protein